MKFKNPLIPGKLIRRYKRFLCDVQLISPNLTVTAHCANSGSLLGLKQPDSKVWLSQKPKNSKARLEYRWELIETESGIVGVNTSHPNDLVQEAIENRVLKELQGYTNLRREINYGSNSRIDLLLESPNAQACYVEVKNVTLKRNQFAEFPDSVTTRGVKHLDELSRIVSEGHRAVIIYVVQRMDCEKFAVAADIDPNYARASLRARMAGVEFLCYRCHINTQEITIDKPLPIIDS